MDPTEHSPEETVSDLSIRLAQFNSQKVSKSKAVANLKPSGIQDTSHHAPQGKQAATPPPSIATRTQSHQKGYSRAPQDRRVAVTRSSIQNRHREASHCEPQGSVVLLYQKYC